jgi:hypothetical protein
MLKFIFLLSCLAIIINAYDIGDILPYHKVNINKVYKYFELTTASNFKGAWYRFGPFLTFDIEMIINDGKLIIKDTFKARVSTHY